MIIHGDCLEELKSVDSNSVDFLLTDPPYGTNDKYGKNIKRHKDGRGQNVSFNVIDWDTKIPLKYLKECHRILKDDRWGVVFTDRKEITYLWEFLEEIGFKPRNTFYWIKPAKAPTPRDNFKSSVETAVVFTKGKTNKKWRGGGDQDNYYITPFPRGDEREDHPTQKPVDLFEKLITLFTDKEDIVLDPFLGSGTTGVASIKNRRDFIGIEEEKENIEISKRRTSEVKARINNSEKWFDH